MSTYVTLSGSGIVAKMERHMTKLKQLVLVSVTALMGATFATAATAAPEPFCRNYAHLAVSTYGQMKSQNMGCGGPRWHGWYDGHYSWCRSTSRGAAQSETLARKRTMFSNQC